MTNKYIKKLLRNHSYISKRARPRLRRPVGKKKPEPKIRTRTFIMDVRLQDTTPMNVKL